MSNTIIKIVAAVTGVGGAIGGGTYYLINNSKESELPAASVPQETKTSKAISEWLSEDNKVLLGTSDSEWGQRWSDFKAAYPKGKAPEGEWAITNWDTVHDGDGAILKTKCSTNGNTKVDSKTNKLYEEVKKYCTKDKTTPSPTPQ